MIITIIRQKIFSADHLDKSNLNWNNKNVLLNAMSKSTHI